ncbi:MAG: hypothetical protein Q6364_00455 [Candidatus Hermodarchaeota archaeon]|nr:hypothetical protein [Candidatus Hermodarchaeota archaeon]
MPPDIEGVQLIGWRLHETTPLKSLLCDNMSEIAEIVMEIAERRGGGKLIKWFLLLVIN